MLLDKSRQLSWSLALVLVICVVSAAAASVPGWFENPGSEYPSEQYLTATGSGASMAGAKKKAKSGISEIFNQKISSVKSMRTDVTETQGDESSFLKKVQQQSRVTVESSAELIGVKIERSTSSFVDGRTRYYALAVLDKNDAIDNYMGEYQQALSRLRSNYGQASETDNAFRKLKYLAAARGFVKKARSYKDIIGVLQSMGGEEGASRGGMDRTAEGSNFKERARQFKKNMKAGEESTQEESSDRQETKYDGSMELKPSVATIEQEFNQVLSQMDIYVQTASLDNVCSGSNLDRLLKRWMEKEFTRLEFSTVDSRDEARFTVTPELSASHTTKGRESDVAIRWDLAVRILDVETGGSFATVNQTDVSVGLDKSNAASRARNHISEWIKQEMSDVIAKKLLG